MTTNNEEILRMAVVGLEAKRAEIDRKIAEIQAQLKGKAPTEIKRRRRRTISEEGRRRIAEAQKARWAKARKAKSAA